MTIECYDSSCKFHNCHIEGQEGPFCDEEECRMIDKDGKIITKPERQYAEGEIAFRQGVLDLMQWIINVLKLNHGMLAVRIIQTAIDEFMKKHKQYIES